MRGLALVHDGTMGAVALLLSFALRLGFDGVAQDLWKFLGSAALFGVTISAAGFLLGLNRGIWRYASLSDFLAITSTASVSITIFTIAEFLLNRLNSIPRSSILIAWAFVIVLLGGPRAAYRAYRNRHDIIRARLIDPGHGKHVLLIGASDNAEVFLRTIKERNSASLKVLAIIDERNRRTGRSIRGVPVMGPLDKLPEILDRFELEDADPRR
ncbi:hypothetical protein AU467_18685 [Mesorhizobium loti]|uniref:Polysaccharide biosynthesis protein n=1 Tax=Rhizobium loti TaxID=381 RepID=A0A117N446_RHILI|nr:hypothetical protein AU467_18685 [Mesorhizobium loti]